MKKLIFAFLLGFFTVVTSSSVSALNRNEILSLFLPSEPKVILDEQFVVKVGESRMQSFKFKRKLKVHVRIDGIKDTDKGFNVYAMPGKEWEKYKRGESFKHYPKFHGLNVIAYSKTGIVPKGRTAFVIANKNNLLNPMQVHYVITVNPEE